MDQNVSMFFRNIVSWHVFALRVSIGQFSIQVTCVLVVFYQSTRVILISHGIIYYESPWGMMIYCGINFSSRIYVVYNDSESSALYMMFLDPELILLDTIGGGLRTLVPQENKDTLIEIRTSGQHVIPAHPCMPSGPTLSW